MDNLKKHWKYLGKTRLYNFLKAKGFTVSFVMRDMEYKKYRGSEFLKGDNVELSAEYGRHICVSVYEYDEELDERIETEYYCFMLVDKIWYKHYSRIGNKIWYEKLG